MFELAKLLVLCYFVSTATGQSHPEFFGGSISYDLEEISPGNHEVHVTMISGWVLGKGPCGQGCSRAMLGTSTLAKRKQIEQQMSNDEYFGHFTVDFVRSDTNNADVVPIDNWLIHNTQTETVLAVNENSKWEQEITKFSFTLMPGVTTGDINFDGKYWRPLTLQGSSVPWHLQSTIKTDIRNDTGKPNRCPKVSFRPYYRVKLDTTTRIEIAAWDPDYDTVQCTAAKWVESGIGRKMPGIVVNKDCTVDIDANSAHGYVDDSWIAVKIVVRDFNQKLITYGMSTYPPVTHSMVSTVLQFAVHILQDVETLTFVSPTPPSGQTFIIYSGAEWQVEIFAKASKNTTLHEITVKVTGDEQVVVSDIKHSLSDDHVSSATVSWTPGSTDIGPHYICVTAEDNTGVESAEDRCYEIHVQENTFASSGTVSSSKPYFIDIPTPQQTIYCPKHATCNVPLYVKTSRNIESIRIVTDYTDGAKIGSAEQTTHDSQTVYKADLSFSDVRIGKKEICFVATDDSKIASDKTCIFVHIEPPNPCISSPCQNSGICKVDKDTGAFSCECVNSAVFVFSGKHCENSKTVCHSITCVHGSCSLHERVNSNTGIKSHCVCLPGYGGYLCDEVLNNCPSNACSNHGTCMNVHSNYSCKCNSRYTSANCDQDSCPNTSSPNELECVPDVCKSDPCNGNGVCSSGPSGPVCTCASGYTDTDCSKANTNIHPSVVDIDFVHPTPKNGATLNCYKKNNQLSSCQLSIFIVSRGGTPTVSVETSKNLSPTTSSMVPNTNDPRLFHTDIQIQGVSKTDTFVCVKATAISSTKERCFVIHLKLDPLDDISSLRYAQRNAAVKFREPTPNEGTDLVCDEAETCIVMLYTTKTTAGCQNAASPNEEVTVFPTKLNTNYDLCETEASFKFTGAGNNTICFQSAMEHYEQRCFTVQVFLASTDPCDTSPCQNEGHCLRTNPNDYKCICTDGYTGEKCEKGPCSKSDNPCRSGSYCSLDDGIKTCLCRTGFHGQSCGIASFNNLSLLTTEFTDTAKPSMLQCVLGLPCGISLILSGGTAPAMLFVRNEPKVRIEYGYIDPEITVGQVHVRAINQTEIYEVDGTITGTDEGLFDACIQAHYNLKTKTKVDEICFKVNVTSDVLSLYGFMDRPHFVTPSLRTHSTVLCTEHVPCHVLYHVTAGEGNSGKCLSAYPTSHSSSLKLHLFSTCEPCNPGDIAKSDCKIDVSILPSDAGIGEYLCIGLRLQNSDVVGEERCFNISVQSTEDNKESRKHGCQYLQCQYGGFCDGHIPLQEKCYCKHGFKENNCYDDKREPTDPTEKTFIDDMNIPEIITCVVEKLCLVPFTTRVHANAATSFSVGYSAPQLRAYIKDGTTRKGSQIRILNIQSTSIGTFKTCVQINDKELTAGEVCVTVKVISSPREVVDVTKPYYVSPTLPDQTTVLCQHNSACHLSLYFATGDEFGHNSECPTIKQVSTSPVRNLHIFDATIENNVCVSDIAYISQDETTVELCVQLSFPGIKGEKRCFNITSVSDIESSLVSPCKGVACYNDGKCIADLKTSTSKCICRSGFEGHDCSNGMDKTQYLPGVAHIGSIPTTNSQRFGVDSAIPKTLLCNSTGLCCARIPYTDKPPFVGFVDPLLNTFPIMDASNNIAKVCVQVIAGTKHRMCLQTSSDGTKNGINIDEICFDILNHPAEVTDQHKPYFKDSMNNGTVLTCQPSKPCHLFVNTNFLPDRICNQVTQCGMEIPGGKEVPGLYIFQTYRYHIGCITEVTVPAGVDGSTQDLCLSAGIDGEERYFQIEATDSSTKGFGPCQQLHCLNNGQCVSKTDKTAECLCSDDYTGITCQISNPCKSYTCANGGTCKPVFSSTSVPKPVCFCTPGYEDDHCSTVVDKTTGLHGLVNSVTSNNQHFMPNSVVPKVVRCENDIPCCITVPYYGDFNLPPTLGYHDSGLSIVTMNVLHTTETNLHNFETCVNGTLGHNHRMCLQTTKDGTPHGMNVDEMCFEVELKKGDENHPVDEPQFTNAPPNTTTVSCTVNKLCHMKMITTSLAGKCQQIEECLLPKTAGLLPRPPVLEGDKCLTDVVFKAGSTSESKSICLSAGYGGEQRHLVIETQSPTDGYGACQKLQCLNGGRCISRDKNGPAECDCPPEYSGRACEQTPCRTITCSNNGKCVADLKSNTPIGRCTCTGDYTGPKCETTLDHSGDLPGVDNLPPGMPSGNQHFDTNTAIPKNIQCFENSTCCIPVTYNGDTSLPPLLGYHDPLLRIDPVTTKRTDNNQGSDTNIALVCTTGEPGTHTLCLQTTTNGTDKGINVDEMCFDVTIKSGEKPDTQPDPRFTESLPDGSSVVCQPSSVCHIPVVTEKHGTTCEQVHRCEHYTIGVQIHNTKMVGDKCVTDVAVVTGTIHETDNLCLSAGSGGEERHILLETKNKTNIGFGPCQKLHCLNGGRCVSETTVAVCTCPPNYTGTHCDVQICVNTNCHHGQCMQDPHSQTKTDICVCDNGYMDQKCDAEVTKNTDLPGVTNIPANTGSTPTSVHHFDSNSALPSNINCNEVNPCCFSVPYHGDTSIPPFTGYHSPGLTVDKTAVIPDANNGNFSTLVTCVKGVPGNHKICLQTSSDGTRQGVNLDEICTQVSIKKGGTTTTPVDPHFTNTPPDMSKVVCNLETTCRVPVVTNKHNGVCEPVKTCDGTTIGTRVYDATETGNQCLTYIGLKTNTNDGTDTLCVSAGNGGEERKLVIETKNTSSTGFGPCQKLHCVNGGSCVSRTSGAVCECLPQNTGQTCELTPCTTITCQNGGHCVADLKSQTPTGICICAIGFSGEFCETSISKNTDIPGVDNIPDSVTHVTQHFGNNTAIPKDIFCDGINPCCVTVPYLGDSSHPPVIGYIDPALTLVTGQSSTIADALGTGSHTTSTCVSGVLGKHRLCIQTTSDGTRNGVNIDEFCVNIKKDNSSLSAPASKPHFTNTLPNGTSVVCHPNTVCHMTVVTDQHNNTCGSVEKCIGTTLGISSLNMNAIGGKCVTEIGVKTGDSGSSDNLCISAGPDGEERYYEIETKEPPIEGYGPCQKVHCLNGGTCIAETDVAAVCKCPSSFVGKTCSVDKNSYLPGTANIPNIPLGNQHFSKNGAIPTNLQCDTENPCCITVPYHGDKDLPPVLGYYDHGLTVVHNITTVTAATSTHSGDHVAEVCVTGNAGKKYKLCLQTTSDGTDEGVNIDELCIYVQVKPGADPTQLTPPSFNPALPEGTTLVCKPNTTCHVSVVTDKHAGTCDTVTHCGSSPHNSVVVGTKPTADRCMTDIKITTGATEKIEDLCISSGNGGSRHFHIETKVKDSYGPCQKLHCLNGGKCVSRTDTAECDCFEGFSGKTCELNDTQNCDSSEEREYARKVIVTGYASCACVVNGNVMNIIKKKPVLDDKAIVKAAGFGAGGMVGTLVIGIIVYATISQLRTPKAEVRRRIARKRIGSDLSSSKIHPHAQPNRRNLETF